MEPPALQSSTLTTRLTPHHGKLSCHYLYYLTVAYNLTLTLILPYGPVQLQLI